MMVKAFPAVHSSATTSMSNGLFPNKWNDLALAIAKFSLAASISSLIVVCQCLNLFRERLATLQEGNLVIVVWENQISFVNSEAEFKTDITKVYFMNALIRLTAITLSQVFFRNQTT